MRKEEDKGGRKRRRRRRRRRREKESERDVYILTKQPTFSPGGVEKTLTTVPLVDAVANIVPESLNTRHRTRDVCASITTPGRCGGSCAE